MADSAAIVLAGGRSSRMGSPKAALDWHGSTLLRRVTGIAGRVVTGPVVVVSAPGQSLPELAPVDGAGDRRARGPRAAPGARRGPGGDRRPRPGRVCVIHGCAAAAPRVRRARRRRLGDDVDVVLPEIGGFRQPLSAAYRVDLLAPSKQLIAADRMQARVPVRALPRAAARATRRCSRDAALAALDPDLASVQQPQRAEPTTSARTRSRARRSRSGASGRSRWQRRAASQTVAALEPGRRRRGRGAGPGRARRRRAQRRPDHPRSATAAGRRGYGRVHGRRRRRIADGHLPSVRERVG